jgi:hypothetical protein
VLPGGSKSHALLEEWVGQRLHVICIQVAKLCGSEPAQQAAFAAALDAATAAMNMPS